MGEVLGESKVSEDISYIYESEEDLRPSNTSRVVDKKRARLEIPIDEFLSNRFIINNIIEEVKDEDDHAR